MAQHVTDTWFFPQRASPRRLIAPERNRRRIPWIALMATLVYIFPLLAQSRAAAPNTGALPDQLVGGEFSYVVQQGDSLTGVSARFGIALAVLAADNHLPSGVLLKLGQELRINNRHIVPNIVSDGIVINIPQRMLFYLEQSRLVRSFPVGLGRYDWPTPTGTFKIVAKEQDPTWNVPPSIQEEMQREGKTVKTCVPPGPDNPLGKHWLGLSISGYGIHGTIAPASIYRFQTHGCIRGHPEDIAGLFNEVSTGTPGILIYRRLMVAVVGGKVYLEVHPDVYKKDGEAHAQFEPLLKGLPEVSFDRELAMSIIRKQDGIAREIGVSNLR